jgi:hypothetical protein
MHYSHNYYFFTLDFADFFQLKDENKKEYRNQFDLIEFGSKHV